MTIPDPAAIASAMAVVLGLIFTEWRGSRRTAAADAAANAKRDAADTKLAEELERLAQAVDHLGHSVTKSSDGLAAHAAADAVFQATTSQTMEGIRDALKTLAGVATDNALLNQRLSTVEASIDWGTHRIEELFRGQSKLMEAMGGGAGPERPAPPPRARTGRVKGRVKPAGEEVESRT